ncbi:hypothetical protein ACIPL1_24965 [Pseudomonas sp. NPDC090202]|uniref:hypothetical protein n=1 Tax=Pseudomonas sp. NPDC090202 TaxID=3364476 RepID=UPI003807D996
MSQRAVGIALALLIGAVVVSGLAKDKKSNQAEKPAYVEVEKTTEELYPAPWVYEFSNTITTALVEAKVKGCGIYKYRVSSGSKSEFLVYCSRDNQNWKAYMVWPNIHKVLGPYAPDSSLD